jgi:hypothetical protein
MTPPSSGAADRGDGAEDRRGGAGQVAHRLHRERVQVGADEAEAHEHAAGEHLVGHQAEVIGERPAPP